jgi:hypothetical protein
MRRSPRDTCLGVFAGICLLAYILPSACFRLRYDQPPLSGEKYRSSGVTVKEGMSSEEVIAALGQPHRRQPDSGPDGGERWIYYTDALEDGYLGIHIGPDGRVTWRWID